MPAETIKADEKETQSSNDFNFIVSEYLETEDYYENLENQTINKVIIYDADGNVTRQIELNEDIELSTPAILNMSCSCGAEVKPSTIRLEPD